MEHDFVQSVLRGEDAACVLIEPKPFGGTMRVRFSRDGDVVRITGDAEMIGKYGLPETAPVYRA